MAASINIFESKDELLLEPLDEAFQEITDRLMKAAKESRPEVAWKAIVTTYLQPEHCSQAENWCPLTAPSRPRWCVPARPW